jgi:hypothetical protein
MATKKIASSQDIYQIKVTLLGTKPPIWRRLLVPSTLTLAQLHDVVQTAMGWQDGHMHEFRAGQRYFGKPDPEYRSMDSRRVAYWAGSGRSRFVVVDGNEGKSFDGSPKGTTIVFDSANALHYTALRLNAREGNTIVDVYLVEEMID